MSSFTSWFEWFARNSDDEELDTFTFYLYLSISVALVLLAGAMSGLTLGLMSLDTVDLEILKRSGEPKQKQCAERIVPVLKRPHLLLVTLLLCNAAAMEALPLFLDRLADPITAIVVSVTAVLAFGEIIPQALCSRYGLQIGAAAAPLVKVLMWITWPISGPVGWLLDQILGERHSALFRRGELKALVDIHKEGQEFGGMLTADEVNIIKGALDLTHKIASSAMTPLDMVFMLPSNAVLDEDTLTAIIASGHSRIPIHKSGNRGEILGILLVKELIVVDKDDKRPVGRFKIRSVPYLRADTPMYDMLKLFEIGRSHMAVLTQPTAAAVMRRKNDQDRQKISQIAMDMDSIDDLGSTGSCPGTPRQPPYDYDPSDMEPVGIITIEDVLEELLQSEIVDETDQYVDNLHHERVNAALLARGLPAHLRSMLNSRNLVPRIGGAAFMTTAPYMSRHDSREDAIAAGVAAAEAGLFRSRPGSEDGAARFKDLKSKPRHPSNKSSPPGQTTAAAAAGAEGGTALSPRYKEQAEVAAASLVTLALQKRAAAQQQGQERGGKGGDPRMHASSSRVPQSEFGTGGSVHGGPPERLSGSRAGQSRRSKQLTQGIKEQMDLLQPLLQRAVTLDSGSLAPETAFATGRRRKSDER